MTALAAALVLVALLAVYALRLWLDFRREERPPMPVVYSNLDELRAEVKAVADKVEDVRLKVEMRR